jgi:pimeloyl-ACP methyl ester carboxylesterase
MGTRSTTRVGSPGSAVLVHGMWSSPADWRWVERLLHEADVEVSVPDLPSHGPELGSPADDAAEVRRAIRACSGPVVVVGWSYGGKIISMAAEGEAAVARLVYVADIPEEVDGTATLDTSWVDEGELIVTGPGPSFVLDDERWLEAEAWRFSGEVLEHLRRNPRRPVSRAAAADPQTAAAWRTIPTTVLVGRHDDLLPADRRTWAAEHLEDVRDLDADHFIPFAQPKVVVDVVVAALGG